MSFFITTLYSSEHESVKKIYLIYVNIFEDELVREMLLDFKKINCLILEKIMDLLFKSVINNYT